MRGSDNEWSLRAQRRQFEISRQELIAELERVTLELSNTTRPSERVPNKFLQRIIKDLKDTKSSKMKIRKLLTNEIRNPQEAECIKQKVTENKITTFCETLSLLYCLYYEAITYLGGRLRTDRTSRSNLEKGEKKLVEALKSQYLSDIGEEWSDVRGEGPIILTKNPVKGDEISPELSDIIKQLKSDGALRYVIYE